MGHATLISSGTWRPLLMKASRMDPDNPVNKRDMKSTPSFDRIAFISLNAGP